MIIAGTGMGFAFAPTAAVVLGSVAPEHHGKASGANTTVREVGGALGIAVLSTVFLHHGSDRAGPSSSSTASSRRLDGRGRGPRRRPVRPGHPPPGRRPASAPAEAAHTRTPTPA